MHLRDLIASIHPFCLVLVVKTTQTFISITYTKITEIIQISILYNLCNRCIKVPGKKHSGGIINCCNFFWKKKIWSYKKHVKLLQLKTQKRKIKAIQGPNLLFTSHSTYSHRIFWQFALWTLFSWLPSPPNFLNLLSTISNTSSGFH